MAHELWAIMGILHPSMNNLYGKFSYKNPFKIYLLRRSYYHRQNRHPDRQNPRLKNSVIVSHFAYLYNRDKEGRKSRALELLTGQHSGKDVATGVKDTG